CKTKHKNRGLAQYFLHPRFSFVLHKKLNKNSHIIAVLNPQTLTSNHHSSNCFAYFSLTSATKFFKSSNVCRFKGDVMSTVDLFSCVRFLSCLHLNVFV